MTIAAGFCYRGGVLLCADTEQTGWAMKLYAAKIFNFDYPGGKIGFAYAGNTGLAISAIQKCQRRLMTTDGNDVFTEVERVVDREYRKNVLSHPDSSQAGLDYQLLVSISPHMGNATLWTTLRTAIRQVNTYECIGVGEHLAHYLLRPDFSAGMDERQLLVLATYMLASVKTFVPNCGGISHFLWLRNGGMTGETYSTAAVGLEPKTSTEWLEKHARVYDMYARNILFQLANPDISDADFESNLKMFGGKVAELRRNFRESNLVHESFQFLGGRNPIQNMSHEG